MNRPGFNKFANGDPKEDYNRRMRAYVVWLELREKRCVKLEHRMAEDNLVAHALHSTQEQNYELCKSMKVLRSQIRALFKEGNHGNEKKNV